MLYTLFHLCFLCCCNDTSQTLSTLPGFSAMKIRVVVLLQYDFPFLCYYCFILKCIFSTCSKGCTIALSLIASLMVNKKYIMPYIYAFSFFYLVHSHAISALSRYYLFYMSGVWVFPCRTCHKQTLYIIGLNYCAQSPRIYHFSHNMYSVKPI